MKTIQRISDSSSYTLAFAPLNDVLRNRRVRRWVSYTLRNYQIGKAIENCETVEGKERLLVAVK